MSLTVPPVLLEQARVGEVDDAEFLDCVRTSLPYAWDVVTGLVKELEASGGEFADNKLPPPDEAARGQHVAAGSAPQSASRARQLLVRAFPWRPCWSRPCSG